MYYDSILPDDGDPEVGVGLEAEGEDGDEYEEDGGEGDDPRPGGRVRLVKQRPDLRLRPLPARRLTCMRTRRMMYISYRY